MEGFKMKSDHVTLGTAQKSLSAPFVIRKWLILAATALMTLSLTNLVDAQGLLFDVNSTGDGDDALVGDGICADSNGDCTLRAAIHESNFDSGEDGIEFDIPMTDPGFNPLTGAWTINLTAALPDVTDSVEITGLGADMLIVRRNTGGDYRIFDVTTAGVVTISDMAISDGNSGSSVGGGISNLNGTVTVTNCVISGNFAGDGGGGLSNGGILNVTNCTINDNHDLGNAGGGIFNSIGTVNLSNSTVSGNSSDLGAGIQNGGFGAGTLNVTNCTVTGNVAGFAGGGINNSKGNVNVTNSTISNNVASLGGGIFHDASSGGPATVKSSIIALNTASSGPDVDGDFSSSGFNLIGKTDGSMGFTSGTDQTGTSAAPLDPKLDSNGLQDNGGPTQTIALLFGSPAIDKGTSDGLTGGLSTDQRSTGFPRTFDDPAIENAAFGDGTDIGAFEVQAPTPSPSPTPVPTTFGNISTRLKIETGDNVLIGGFIITGSQAKKVMVRAIGPSLPLAGVLANPTLELHGGAGALISSNDNWMDAPNKQEIIDSTIPPTNDLESAILMSLDPGLYTAIVSGVNDTTGIALVEVYDLDPGVDSILANISTRGLVQTGDDVMIGGIIILGTDAQDVLLRVIGPSLPLTGALAGPTRELHDKDGLTIASNDDWRSDQEAEIIATTIPPADDAESAILMTLAPDAYTAIVRGKDNTTGIALVEAYQLDN
jgi:hypothetical protein